MEKQLIRIARVLLVVSVCLILLPVACAEKPVRAKSAALVALVDAIADDMRLDHDQREKLHRIVYVADGKEPGTKEKLAALIEDTFREDPKVFACVLILYEVLDSAYEEQRRGLQPPANLEPKSSSPAPRPRGIHASMASNPLAV